MKKHILTQDVTGKETIIAIIGIPLDSYRKTLIINKALTKRYGNFEVTSRADGIDRIMHLDNIENIEMLCTLDHAVNNYECMSDHPIRQLLLDTGAMDDSTDPKTVMLLLQSPSKYFFYDWEHNRLRGYKQGEKIQVKHKITPDLPSRTVTFDKGGILVEKSWFRWSAFFEVNFIPETK